MVRICCKRQERSPFVHGSALIATAVTAATAPVHAQSWPTKQTDQAGCGVSARRLGGSGRPHPAQPLQAQLGQTVIVENKGGARFDRRCLRRASARRRLHLAVVFDSHAVNPALIPEPSL